jgi:hypothetical protein
VQLRVAWLKLPRGPDDDNDGVTEEDMQRMRRNPERLDFPGSQPVSLSCDNQDLIHSKRCATTAPPLYV